MRARTEDEMFSGVDVLLRTALVQACVSYLSERTARAPSYMRLSQSTRPGVER